MWCALLPAIGLQCFIDSHTRHPSAKAGFRPECRQTAPDFQGDILEDIIRIGLAPHQRADTSSYHGEMPIHQGRKALGLACQ